MNKGGDIDTGGFDQAKNLANWAAQLAGSNWTQGADMTAKYGYPVWNELLQIAGLGPGGKDKFFNPALARSMQGPLNATLQGADAARKDIMAQDMGPGAKGAALGQLNLAKMGSMQQSALQTVQNAIAQLLGVGREGEAMMTGAPGQITGAANAMTSASAALAQLQARAAESGNMGLYGGLMGISSIAGLLFGSGGSGGWAGKIAGLFGGGGSGGDTGYSTGGFDYMKDTF